MCTDSPQIPSFYLSLFLSLLILLLLLLLIQFQMQMLLFFFFSSSESIVSFWVCLGSSSSLLMFLFFIERNKKNRIFLFFSSFFLGFVWERWSRHCCCWCWCWCLSWGRFQISCYAVATRDGKQERLTHNSESSLIGFHSTSPIPIRVEGWPPQ